MGLSYSSGCPLLCSLPNSSKTRDPNFASNSRSPKLLSESLKGPRFFINRFFSAILLSDSDPLREDSGWELPCIVFCRLGCIVGIGCCVGFWLETIGEGVGEGVVVGVLVGWGSA